MNRDMKEKRQLARSQVAYEILLRGWDMMTWWHSVEETVIACSDISSRTSLP